MFEFIGAVGRAAILTGFIAAAVSAIAYFRGLKNQSLTTLGRNAYHVTAVCMFIASAVLMILILKHQFQFEYVWSYSSRELPLGLLMSTFYAGQEGSIMFWTLMVVFVGIALMSYTMKHNNEREVMGIYASVLFFLMLLIVVKNPFALIEGGQVPPDGRGLNPLLQNFWMQIHPPILFIGFASMTPPFALAIGALIQKKYQDWIVASLPWVVGGAMVLGLGIALGGFWAYETLGWGGWWGWDPVENSSLLPWLVSVATVHTMLTQKRTKGLVLTNFVLAISAFVMVVYSTFLTRSGVLGEASVHSFVDPGRFAFTLLVLFMFAFTDVGFGFLFARFTAFGSRIMQRYRGTKRLGMFYLVAIGPSIPLFAQIAGDLVPIFQEVIDTSTALNLIFYPLLGLAHFLNAMSHLWIPALIIKIAFIGYVLTGRFHSEKEFTSFNIFSRETFLAFGASVIGAFTLIVLLGTSLPIIPRVIVDGANSVLATLGSQTTLGNTVDPEFYDSMGLPLAIIIAIMTASALHLKWKKNDAKHFLRSVSIDIAIAVACTAILFLAGDVTHMGMLTLGFSASFSLAVNLRVGATIAKGNWRFIGAYVAHAGIALMLLGIIGSGFYSKSIPLELPQGKTKEAFGYKLTYVGYEPFWNGQRYYFNVKVENADNEEIETVKTIMFVSNYGNQEQLMRNPGIAKFWTKDIYLEPQALYEPDPEGGERVTLVKGESKEFGGYTVRFDEFDMNNSVSSEAFTIGAAFTVSKYGSEPQELLARRTTGPDGVQQQPALVANGDLQIDILNLTPNREDLSMSTLEIRLRNPNVKPDPTDLRETLVVEASLKPFISVVWIGIILMVLGFLVARFRRAHDAKRIEHPVRANIPMTNGKKASAPVQTRKEKIQID